MISHPLIYTKQYDGTAYGFIEEYFEELFITNLIC